MSDLPKGAFVAGIQSALTLYWLVLATHAKPGVAIGALMIALGMAIAASVALIVSSLARTSHAP